ncbi:small integral membrane protein 22 [Dromiciops gliroides]|uniref:small integral membrane protein 22 n=1 Tax=Dromiciops gliroides TaxID=33562 RepID=UPI001CC542A3|nr:small integral membrane protein 22 [Dromiciops gliroides]
MAPSIQDVGSELQYTAQQLLSRLESHHLFQSEWDIVALVIFLTFVGTVLLLILLVLFHCCCCCCRCRNSSSLPKRRLKGVDNLALEP